MNHVQAKATDWGRRVGNAWKKSTVVLELPSGLAVSISGLYFACGDFFYPVKFLDTTNSLSNYTYVSFKNTRLAGLIFLLSHVKLPDIGTILLVLASKRL